jgi:hypothetical protein
MKLESTATGKSISKTVSKKVSGPICLVKFEGSNPRRVFMKHIYFVLVLVLCFLWTPLATAQVAPENATNFAIMGLTRGQTLQINLVAFPPGPCFAQLGFQNSTGDPVGTTTAVTLQAGESASLAINGNSLTSAAGERVQVLPTVVPVAGIANSCQASAEIFDNALGITSVLVPGAVSYSSNPSLGTLGVTVLQTVRLNVVAFPPDPCIGQISFLNSDGALVGNALMNVNLSPGKATFLDLPGSALVSKLGQRAEVLPVVTPSSASPNSCVPSAEVYINGLGTTSSYYPPGPCEASSTMCASF